MSGLNDPQLRRSVEKYEHIAERKRKWFPLVFVLTMLLLAVGGVWYAQFDTSRSDRRYAEAAEFGEENRERVRTLEQYVEAQRSQFEACKGKDTDETDGCEEPISPPADEIDTDEEIPPTVIRETLSPADLRTAVAAFCGDTGECEGEPTDAQLDRAVQTYCDARSGCQADPLQPAQPDPGPTGPAGPAGRGPTAEEIDSAITRYCANDACRGQRGEPGRPAEEIVELACSSSAPLPFDLTLRLTFDSGRTLEQSCSTAMEPEGGQ